MFTLGEVTRFVRSYGGSLQTASTDLKAMVYLTDRINAEVAKNLREKRA